MTRTSLGVAASALLASTVAASPAAAFNASFSWSGIPACSSVSPAFRISGAPAGTTRLRFAMSDYNAPNFNHGGSTVDYDGKGAVAKGAIRYVGPCPPSGQHRYIWTIEALDAGGRVLGSARAEGMFPPK